MKTFNAALCAFALIALSCSKPKEAPVDLTQSKTEVTTLVDKFHTTMKSKDATALMGLLAEDGFYCGTDPSEVYDKKTMEGFMTKALADTALVIEDYPILKREMKVDTDGEGAYILDQFVLKAISPTIPLRLTMHAVKNEGSWLLDFFSLSVVPKNEDLPNMSAVVK